MDQPQLSLQEHVKMEEKSRKIKHSLYKLFLICLKYICHIEGIIYVLYTILSFCDIDAIYIGYIANVSLLPWLFIYLASWAFEFCYVHRLPLYYILANECFTTYDFFFLIPLSDRPLMVIHLLAIGFLIIGYAKYYQKYIIVANR